MKTSCGSTWLWLHAITNRNSNVINYLTSPHLTKMCYYQCLTFWQFVPSPEITHTAFSRLLKILAIHNYIQTVVPIPRATRAQLIWFLIYIWVSLRKEKASFSPLIILEADSVNKPNPHSQHPYWWWPWCWLQSRSLHPPTTLSACQYMAATSPQPSPPTLAAQCRPSHRQQCCLHHLPWWHGKVQMLTKPVCRISIWCDCTNWDESNISNEASTIGDINRVFNLLHWPGFLAPCWPAASLWLTVANFADFCFRQSAPSLHLHKPAIARRQVSRVSASPYPR